MKRINKGQENTRKSDKWMTMYNSYRDDNSVLEKENKLLFIIG